MQHPGEFQQFGHFHAQGGEMLLQGAGDRAHPRHQRRVQVQSVVVFARAQAQVEFQFAAANARGDPLAHRRFQGPQFVGRAHADFQKPMIHRAQFAAERAGVEGTLAGGVSGHAADHGRP
jgi:hypothetical protein